MSFNAIAPHYGWLEALLAGGKLQRCRTEFLDEIPVPGRILLMGEGHGRSLTECCRRFPEAHITYVDASLAMIEQAAKVIEPRSAKQVKFVHADAREWKADGDRYDLIVTNFFLDCFTAVQLEQLIAALADVAAPSASWLVADFQQAPRGVKRWRTEAILWLMYRAFRLLTRLPARNLTSPDRLLNQYGFRLRSRMETDWQLLHSDWWQSELGRQAESEALIPV